MFCFQLEECLRDKVTEDGNWKSPSYRVSLIHLLKHIHVKLFSVKNSNLNSLSF